MASHDHNDGSTAREENRNPVASANGNGDLQVKKDILLGLFEEHRAHARHTETLRSTAIGLLIVASAALVTLATYDRELNWWDVPAASLLIAFGFLGAFFNFYHSEQIWKHKVRAREYWKELDETVYVHFEGQPLREIRARADDFRRAFGTKNTNTTMEMLVGKWIDWREKRRGKGQTEGRVETAATFSSLLLWTVLPLFISMIGFSLLVLMYLG